MRVAGNQFDVHATSSLNFKVQVRRAAELDVGEAQGWYETQRSGLDAEFHSEISQIFTVLK